MEEESRTDVLIVDDEAGHLAAAAEVVRGLGLNVATAHDGTRALDLFYELRPPIVVSDWKMPGLDGLKLLKRIKKAAPKTYFIMMTAFASVEHAVRTMEAGANTYLEKPLKLKELRSAVRQAVTETARGALAGGEGIFGGEAADLGAPAMIPVLEKIRNVAPTNATVLVVGESGTGKEVVAKAIHRLSLRSDKLFIPVHCGALVKSLLESELFGHVRGAFTGAVTDRKGVFEVAGGGTIFLDEIGEMPPETQARLLRVLENREITRVGSSVPTKADVRVIAASNSDLERAVGIGAFRKDLYFRLKVVTIELPPLREHPEDIPELIDFFLAEFSRVYRRTARFTDDAVRMLATLRWPGNIRELKNFVEKTIVTAPDRPITADDLKIEGEMSSVNVSTPCFWREGMTLRDAENAIIAHVLRQTGGNRRRTARLLGIGERTLYRKLGEAETADGESPPA